MGSKLGIDFGTSNSSAALHYKDPRTNKLETICFDLDWGSSMRECLQSVVSFGKTGEFRFGRKAREYKAANTEAVTIISELKTRMRNSDNDSVKEYNVGPKKYSDINLVGMLLSELRSIIAPALLKLNIADIEGVVIGVPVGCGEKYKRYFSECLVGAGFFDSQEEANEKIEFVSEPIAVALFYETKLDIPQTALVFDFGGGTLDLAVMQIGRMGAKRELLPGDVMAKDCRDLGGDILTKKFFLNAFLPKYGRDLWLHNLGFPADLTDQELWVKMQGTELGYRLVVELEKCKVVLSLEKKSTVSFLEGKIAINIEFTRNDFEGSIQDELKMIERAVNECLRSGGTEQLRTADIDVVLMAGGSSLIPAVQGILIRIFNKKVQIGNGESMITSIARGLAVAGYSDDDSRPRFLDIAECDYGIWLEEERRVSVIIPRNTKVNETRIDRFMSRGMKKRFQTVYQNPTFVKLKVFEVSPRREKAQIGCIESKLQGQDTFDIYFSLDNEKRNGQLKVDVYDCVREKFMDEIPEKDRCFIIDKELRIIKAKGF